MCRAELLAQQPVLSGAVVFGACVCGRVTTRLVQTCAVTIREPIGSTRRPWSGSIKTSADGHVHTKQDDLWAKQPVDIILVFCISHPDRGHIPRSRVMSGGAAAVNGNCCCGHLLLRRFTPPRARCTFMICSLMISVSRCDADASSVASASTKQLASYLPGATPTAGRLARAACAARGRA